MTVISHATLLADASLTILAYGLFVLLVLALLAIDLGVFHRKDHVVGMKEAAGWSVVWISLGLLFSVFVHVAYDRHWLGLGEETRLFNPAAAHDPHAPLIIHGTVTGTTAAVQYLTGYVVEKSLAMDNIFVIALLFGFFAVPGKYQHRVLFWGILGALLMRGAMIGIGGELIMRYQWVLIFFGLFLVLTALKMIFIHSETDPSRNIIVRAAKRIYPVTRTFHGRHFFVRVPVSETIPHAVENRPLAERAARSGATVMAITPLFLALIMIEITDLVFAVDSIPAIFAITPDPFIVFTSNIFALLGLRSLYFCLAVLITRFRYLKPALIAILVLVGIKLLLMSVPPYLGVIGLAAHKAIKIDPIVSLVSVLAILALAIVASVLRPGVTEDKSMAQASHG